MTLTRLRLKNWRNWKELDTPLSMLTAITPKHPESRPNNIGKTNVLRAVRWVMLNDAPPLEEVITPGAEQAEVEVWLSTGYSVKRLRSASRNAYEVTDPEGHVLRYEAVGRGAVPDIVKLFGIVELPEFSPYFQGSEYPSVLDLRPKDFAGLLGRLSGTTVLEEAVSIARKMASEATTAHKVYREELDECRATVEQLAPIVAARPLLEALDSIYRQGSQVAQRQTALEKLLARAADVSPLLRAAARSDELAELTVKQKGAVMAHMLGESRAEHTVELLRRLRAEFKTLTDNEIELSEIMDSFDICPFCWRELE